ncbi:MAG: YggT family protein [Candidatus Puniceispirillales bacterium]
MAISLLQLTDTIIMLYIWSLLALVVSSWLIVFRIVNPYQPVVRVILQGLSAIHEPILQPIRVLQYRLIPNLGGFDLSPIVALLVAQYIVGPMIKSVIINLFF